MGVLEEDGPKTGGDRSLKKGRKKKGISLIARHLRERGWLGSDGSINLA